MRFASLFIIVIIPLILAVPVLLGVYVYRDASGRGMNAALWTLLALLGPAFSGLILYLLVRGNRGGSCPRCGQRVREDYTVCPSCGARLHPACPQCGYPAEPEWRVCPRCAQPLPEDWPEVTPPEIRPDHTLRKILLVIVLIPVLLFSFALLMFTRGSEGGSSSQTSVGLGDYLAASDHAAELQKWLDTVDRTDRAYALRYVTKSGDQYEVRYVVYIPSLGDQDRIAFGIGSGFFGRTLTLDVDTDSTQGGGNRLILLVNHGSKPPRLQVELRGRKIDCLVTDADWPLEWRMENEINEILTAAGDEISLP